MTPAESRPVLVGVVGKAVGVRGEVYVIPDVDLGHDFEPGTSYRTPDGRALTVLATRLHAGRRVVRFDAVEERGAAEQLRGTRLLLTRDDVPLPDDAFWADDLIGREVRDEAGELVGVVEGVRDGAAHDYLVVARPDGGEALLPMVAELVDVRDDAVVVRAIPGLLDDGG